LIDRWRDRRALRNAQARWQAWEATHPREPLDDLARRAQIRQQLWLEHMPAHVQAYLLRQRRPPAGGAMTECTNLFWQECYNRLSASISAI
jgi:hypothetical protein